MHAAHNVDDLGHPEAHRDAAQGVGVVRGQFGAGRQKLDGVARRQAHRRIEILVETHGDPVGRRFGDRPLKLLLLVQDDLDQHLLHPGFERGEADLTVALHGMRVAGVDQTAGLPDRQIECRAFRQLAQIQISAMRAGRHRARDAWA